MRKEPNISPEPVFNITKPIPTGRIDWTSQLDEYLGEVAIKHKCREWKNIAIDMQVKFANPQITAKRCRERWACCVNPEITKAALTDAECVLLLINHNNMQNRWSKMSKKLTQRYSSTLKNNFYSLVRSVLRKILSSELERVSCLYLLQSIYVSWIANKLLQQESSYKPTKGDVPIHIQTLVLEKGLSVPKCENHLRGIVKGILSENSERIGLTPLKNYYTIQMFYDLFVSMAPSLEAKLEPMANIGSSAILDNNPESIEEILLTEIEKALNMTRVEPSLPLMPALASETVSPAHNEAQNSPYPLLMNQVNQTYVFSSTAATCPTVQYYIMPYSYMQCPAGSIHNQAINAPIQYFTSPSISPLSNYGVLHY